MTRLLYPALLAFTITLAAIVGWRLSADSLPVVLGVTAGVLASIPTSLLVAWVAARVALDRYAPRRPQADSQPAPEPRVIIVQTPAQPPNPSPYPASPISPPASPLSSPARHFTLLGHDDDLV